MTLAIKKAQLIQQIGNINSEQFLDKIAVLIEHEFPESTIMKYVSPTQKVTNIEELMKEYRPPNLSNVVGVFQMTNHLKRFCKC